MWAVGGGPVGFVRTEHVGVTAGQGHRIERLGDGAGKLVGATGSIAVSSLPDHLAALRERLGGSCTVLMTHTATSFIPPQTVGLAADRVVEPVWHESYDVAAGTMLGHPGVPEPKEVAAAVAEVLG